MKTQRCILTKFTLQVFSSVANSKIRNQNIQCHRTGCSYLLNSNFHLEVFEIFTQNARLIFRSFFFLNMQMTRVIFVSALELVGPTYRTFTTVMTCIFYTIGILLLSGVAYLIRDWVILCYATTLPFLLFFIYMK